MNRMERTEEGTDGGRKPGERRQREMKKRGTGRVKKGKCMSIH